MNSPRWQEIRILMHEVGIDSGQDDETAGDIAADVTLRLEAAARLQEREQWVTHLSDQLAAARLAGRIEQAETMHVVRCRCNGGVDPACQMERDRLRREGGE